MHDLAKSLESVAWVPLLGNFLRPHLVKPEFQDLHLEVGRDLYKPRLTADAHIEAVDATWDFVARRYDCGVADLQDCARLLDSQHIGEMVTHPVLLAIAKKDYGAF